MLASPEVSTLPSGLPLLVHQVAADSSLIPDPETPPYPALSQLLPGPLGYKVFTAFATKFSASEISKRLSGIFPHFFFFFTTNIILPVPHTMLGHENNINLWDHVASWALAGNLECRSLLSLGWTDQGGKRGLLSFLPSPTPCWILEKGHRNVSQGPTSL